MLTRLFSSPARVVSLLRLATVALCVVALGLAAAVVVLPDPARAQTSPLDILKGLKGDGSDGSTGDVAPTVQTFSPAPIPSQSPPPSGLENIYSGRAGVQLNQFGYTVLGTPQSATITQSGAIPDSYILGSNDELVINFRGQENSTYRVRVDRDGNVILPKLAPIPAAGRRFGDFRANLEQQVAQAFISTKVFVTIGNMHMMSILVSGEVRAPGVRNVSALASPLDVILLSGGIKKTGSLRNVQIVSADGRRVVDLYSVIAQGNSTSLGALHDGDRIYVPPLGATVAVSGNVMHPAIYELAPGTNAISAAALIRLAGGTPVAGKYTMAKYALLANGRLALVPLGTGTALRSGEILNVSMDSSAVTGRVSLIGAAAVSRAVPLSVAHNVSDLFHSAADLGPNAYAPFALIRRRDPVTNAPVLVAFSITAVIRKTQDVALQDEDVVYVLNRNQAQALAAVVIEDINSAYSPGAGSAAAPGQLVVPGVGASNGLGTAPSTPSASAQGTTPVGATAGSGVDGAIAPGQNDASTVDPRFAALAGSLPGSAMSALAQAQALLSSSGGSVGAGAGPQTPDSQNAATMSDDLLVSPEMLRRAASDNLSWVLDQVRDPGPYLAAKGTSLYDIVQAAGGFLQTADLSQIEVTSTVYDQIRGRSTTTRTNYSQADGQLQANVIRPLDIVRVRPIYSDRESGTVTVAGQVRYPGVFDITRDERLSSLLQRAGGMTEVAYPYGAIFTRKSAALAEKEGNERSARELENQIPALTFRQSSSTSDAGTAGVYLSSLARSLRDMPALGRIVVTADPAVLAVKPELDFVLQPGDTLYVPKRPSTVTVSGEVRNPGSFQYRAGLTYEDYVRYAGGTTQNADGGRTFVIMPDGSAAPIDSSWLSFGGGGGRIPPGATVVVPRDLRPFDLEQVARDVSQILSQIAVAAASIVVLSRNN